MGHFAKVINGIVIKVNVANTEWIEQQHDQWAWYETSYNIRGGVYYNQATGQPHEDQSLATATPGRRRKNFASIGFAYDTIRDAFIPPTPFPSWVLNEDTCLWEPPIPRPQDNKQYIWNESAQEWTYTGFYYENDELKKDHQY